MKTLTTVDVVVGSVHEDVGTHVTHSVNTGHVVRPFVRRTLGSRAEVLLACHDLVVFLRAHGRHSRH